MVTTHFSIIMSTVKCPLCNENILGDGPDVLSKALKEHLYRLHELRVVDAVGRFSSEPQDSTKAKKEIDALTHFSPEPTDSPASKKEIDVVTRWNSESPDSPKGKEEIDKVSHFSSSSPQGATPESAKLIEVVTRFKAEYPNGCAPDCQELLEETEKFAKPAGPDKVGGKGRKASRGSSVISCPFCDTVVRGKDDSDLSIQLREHISLTHRAA